MAKMPRTPAKKAKNPVADRVAKAPAAASQKKRSRKEYEGVRAEDGSLMDYSDMPVTLYSTYGERTKRQAVYESTGDDHELEHVVGHESAAQGKGRPGTGLLGDVEKLGIGYLEAKFHHRSHIGTGTHGEGLKRKQAGTRDIVASDLIRRSSTPRQRAEIILARIAARSGRYPVEDEKHSTVKQLVTAHMKGASPRDMRALSRPVLSWMRESSAGPPRPPDPDVYGFKTSAEYRESQENSLMNAPAQLAAGAASTPSDVMDWGKDAHGKPIAGDPDYVPDRHIPDEARVGDAFQLNQLGYAFQPGFQRLGELPTTGKLGKRAAKLLSSARELGRQQTAADHDFLSMALNMEDVTMVDPSKAPDIKPVRPAKKARKE